jgi:hypothetical protein
MRKVICCAFFLSFLPAHADDSQHYKDWLAFKQAFAEEVSGPTGIYAIQDMVELDPGESAYLSSGDVDSLRWSKAARPAAIARVQFKDRVALIRGPGIKERDLLQPGGEALALPNGLTVRGTLLRDRTSGKTTYGGGRVVDIHVPKGSPPQTITFDLNTAYSFLCAHSEFFNCPLVLANNLDVELKFGEKYPPLSNPATQSSAGP